MTNTSWVGSLFRALRGYPDGRRRGDVIDAVLTDRKQLGAPLPEAFDRTVQSAYNHHCRDSDVWKKKSGQDDAAFFYSPAGKGSGLWAVDAPRCETWLRGEARQAGISGADTIVIEDVLAGLLQKAPPEFRPATTTNLYTPGFGNHISTEAVPGALPIGRNSPQCTPFGLYAEQLSGTAFTAPRSENRRSWLYRLRPTANHGAFVPYTGAPHLKSAPFDAVPPSPNRLRWDPLPLPAEQTDWLDGLVTYGGTGSVAEQSGVGIHLYAANRDMDRAFFSADGELLIVPQQGRHR